MATCGARGRPAMSSTCEAPKAIEFTAKLAMTTGGVRRCAFDARREDKSVLCKPGVE